MALVNDDDATIINATYAPGVPRPHWSLGDFDYNGFVDDDDVTLLGVFYDPSAMPLATVNSGVVHGSSVAVPEPPTAILGAVVFLFLSMLIVVGLAMKRCMFEIWQSVN